MVLEIFNGGKSESQINAPFTLADVGVADNVIWILYFGLQYKTTRRLA